MDDYPLIFGIRDPILGKGFVASVAVNGRALMREEEDGFWIDGVNPGAVCAGGTSRDEAWLRFRESYRMILFDFAARSESFDDFKTEVERFFWEETPGEAEAWQQAVQKMKQEPKRGADWLPRKTDYPATSIHVVCLEAVKPDDNAHVSLATAA